LSSGAGRAGIAVIRLSGSGARRAIEALAGIFPQPRRAHYAVLRDPQTGATLDRGLVLWFPGPASFSGEDMAEFHVHGGAAVVEAVLGALAHLSGFRPAERGEFTRRAFENGKLDLSEAEGLADLIDAETEAQRRQALFQAGGGLGRQFEDWRERLIAAMALVESALDYSDEADAPAEPLAQAAPQFESLIAELRAALANDRRGEILREGVRVAILGAPNAGKSSLLNALARRDAAIVSDEPGTTRDIIEVKHDLDGYPFILSDTAGLREAAGAIEREGIRRALARAGEADLVLYLRDATAGDVQPQALAMSAQRVLLVWTKTDLRPPPASGEDALAISALTGAGLDDLRARLVATAKDVFGLGEPALITRARHRAEIERALAALEAFRGGDGKDMELLAEDLREAASALARLTGRVDVEDVLDRLFADFCIGK
jgi:tRNA modification GTPase